MNDIETEAAAWRIWYRVQSEGPESPTACRSGAGLTTQQFEHGLYLLKELGAVEEQHTDDGDVLSTGENPPAIIPVMGEL